MILGLGGDGLDGVALVVDLGEELQLVLAGVEVVDHAVVVAHVAVGDVERRGDDDLVILLDLAVDGDEDLAVAALDLGDLGIDSRRVHDVVVELLPDPLGALLPGPEVDLDEVHRGLEVEVLEDVGRGDLVEVAVAEGSVGPDPDVLHELAAVLLAELVEGQSQVLEVLVDALDLLTAGGDGVAVVTAFGDAAVAVDVIALVLGLEELAEELDLLFHLEQAGDLQDVLLGLERLDDLAGRVFGPSWVMPQNSSTSCTA